MAIHGRDVQDTSIQETMQTPTSDTWDYVGTDSYHSYLDHALEHGGFWKSPMEMPSYLSPDEEKFIQVVDMVNEVFTRNKRGHRVHLGSITCQKDIKDELLRLVERRNSKGKRYRFCKYSPEAQSAVPLALDSEKGDVPLTKWELATVNSDSRKSLLEFDPLNKDEQCRLCTAIDERRQECCHLHSVYLGSPVPLEHEMAPEDARIGTEDWVVVDFIRSSSDDNEDLNVRTKEGLEEGMGVQPYTSPSTYPIHSINSTTEVLEPRENAMAATIGVTAECNTMLDDLTLREPLTPSKIPIPSLENVVYETKEKSKQKKKSRANVARNSAFLPLDHKSYSAACVVQADEDWIF